MILERVRLYAAFVTVGGVDMPVTVRRWMLDRSYAADPDNWLTSEQRAESKRRSADARREAAEAERRDGTQAEHAEIEEHRRRIGDCIEALSDGEFTTAVEAIEPGLHAFDRRRIEWNRQRDDRLLRELVYEHLQPVSAMEES